jgi:predicted heme/steroid binding protein
VPLFDRSQVAQHNDDAHGHWLILDGFVYDVSELMRIHPGGPRILQLYAGRDATAGFRRVHHEGAQVDMLLARARLGALRELACLVDPEHASHSAAAHALLGALSLVVEMQNALRADHAFQLLPLHTTAALTASLPRSRYELQRGIETHIRFQREYLDVLARFTLGSLASAICIDESDRDSRGRLERSLGSEPCAATRAGALALLEGIEAFTDNELSVRVACFEVLDGWLLRSWKRELSRALQALEVSHAATLQLCALQRVSGLCGRLLDGIDEYFRSACSVGR